MSETGDKIDTIRQEWGERLLILGHHYERSSVVAHADEKGDSLELARKDFPTCPEVARMVDFYESSKDGVVRRTEED